MDAIFDLSKAYAEKNDGDPIKVMGFFTITCGICPCIVAFTYICIYASLFTTAATYTSN